MSVEFAGDSPLTEEDRARFAAELQPDSLVAKGGPVDASSFESAGEAIRQHLMNRGYFHVVVTPTPFLVRATPEALEYALRIQIESGPQYHVGSIRLVNADPDHGLKFDSSLLRQKIPLDRGDIFDVSKLRDGILAASLAYQERGYIDVTIEPEFDIQDAQLDHPTINLLLHVDEQIPYRVTSVKFLGLDPRSVEKLQSRLAQQTGALFSPTLWADFFEQNKSILPPDSSAAQNLRIIKNSQYGLVDIALDFRPCPYSRGLDLPNLQDPPQ